MSLNRSQLIEMIVAALPRADAETLGNIYNMLVPDDVVAPCDAEHFVHQDMVD